MTVYEVHVSLKYADAAEISLPSLYAGASEMPVKARAQVALASVSDGAKGDPGPKGSDGQMLVATSATAAATAAKVATLRSGTLSLKAGASVTVVFSEANTAASPTLNVGGTGAKAIRTNGTPYAYWVAGTAVSFVYDGTYWQVCSVPVYASTVTVGNPGGPNVYIDSDGVHLRMGADDIASFLRQLLRLGGSNSTISLAGDALRIDADMYGSTNMPEALLSVPLDDPGGVIRFGARLSNGHVSDEGFSFKWQYGGKDGSFLGGMSVDGPLKTSGVVSAAGAKLSAPLPLSSGGTGATSIDAARRNLHISQGSKVCHGHGTPWVTLFDTWADFQAATGCYGSGTPTLITMNGDWSAFDGALSGCEVQGGKAVYVLAQTTSGLPNISSSQSLRINWICIW